MITNHNHTKNPINAYFLTCCFVHISGKMKHDFNINKICEQKCLYRLLSSGMLCYVVWHSVLAFQNLLPLLSSEMSGHAYQTTWQHIIPDVKSPDFIKMFLVR